MSIRLVVVDDHAVVRHGLAMLVDLWPDVELVGTAADGAEAVAVAAEVRPDVVLMDLAMPGVDGVEATAGIKRQDPGCKVVVLTSLGEQRQILEAMDAGADGYLFKHAEPEEILRAVRTAVEGGVVLDPKAARALVDRGTAPAAPVAPATAAMSGREVEVLRLVAAGLANKQIARRLGIAERTVKAHLTHVFAALGVTDRTQAALWAQANLPPEG